MITSNKGPWCVGEDFNVIRFQKEWRNYNGIKIQMSSFEEFINNSCLVNLTMIGRCYTQYHPNDNVMSKLDRFLLSKKWLLQWDGMRQWGLDRNFSNHYPILLKCEVKNWGPKPFSFLNSWLSHLEFRDQVSSLWNSANLQGWNGFFLKEELKATKKFLKAWSKENFREIDGKIIDYKTKVNKLDLKGEKCILFVEEVVTKMRMTIELWQLLKIKEDMLRQKSRLKWIKEGDVNTSFFHHQIKGR